MSTIRRFAFALIAATAACASKPPAPATPTPPVDEPLELDAPPPDEPPAAARPPATVELSGGQIQLSEPVVFETGTATLAADSDGILGAVAELLVAKPDLTLVRIEGHSDAQGADEFNQRMSEQRALAIAHWLAAHGVECQRLIPVGFGETKPVADNATAEGRAQNRRMDFFPAALRGRLIGGMPADGGGQVAGDPCP